MVILDTFDIAHRMHPEVPFLAAGNYAAAPSEMQFPTLVV